MRVHGRVQGVFFRASTQEEARRLGVSGYAKNCLDGSVEIVAYGQENAVEGLVDWARSGPPLAVVESLVIESPLAVITAGTPVPATFEIRRG